MKKLMVIVSLILLFSVVSGYAAESDVPGWNFTSNGRNAEVKLIYDSSKIKAGDVAMCIIPDENNGEFVISQSIDTVVGSTYEFVANVIGTRINSVSIEAGGETKNVRNGTSARYTPATAYKVTWTATGTSYNVSMIIAGNSEFVYADEFAVYKDGDTSVNLLENPGFEAGKDITPPAEVINPEVTESEAKLTLRWTDPIDEDLDKIIITGIDESGEKTDEVYEIEKGVGKLEINNLDEWTEYSYLIQTKDNTLGNISEGIKLTATTKGVTYTTGDYIVTSDEVSIEVKNIAEDNFTAELVILVYDAEGKKVDAVSSTKTPVQKGEQPTTLRAEGYTIPQGGSAKVLLWNGVYQMRCLKPSMTINAVSE